MNDHQHGELGADFPTMMEGHYTTHVVGWIDYAIIIVSTIVVLVTTFYTIKYLLPRFRSKDPAIKYLAVEGEARGAARDQ